MTRSTTPYPSYLILLTVAVLSCFCLVMCPGRAVAQDGRQRGATGFPSAGPFDPETFLEQFFGGDSDTEKKRLAAVPISLEEERRFGEQALQAFLAQLRSRGIRVLSRGPEVEYVESLVSQLKPLMKNSGRYRSIRVLLAETRDTDARCFPGGTLVIFQGLLAVAQSEAALVSVLGHELSHIDHGHQLRPLRTMKLAQQTFSGPPQGMDFQRMMSSTMFLAKSFARPFRPEEETEADADGVAWAYQLGYDPHELAKLFLRLARRDNQRDNNVPTFFRTHPYHRDRYEAVVAQLKELQRSDPRDHLYIGQRNLMELIPRNKRQYDE